jgi:hypothetical protein
MSSETGHQTIRRGLADRTSHNTVVHLTPSQEGEFKSLRRHKGREAVERRCAWETALSLTLLAFSVPSKYYHLSFV